jgi:transposase
MGRVAKGRFEARVRDLAEGNPMLEAAANPIRASRRMLRQELAGLEKLLRNHVQQDPVCQTLMTMPGVGALIALTVKAALAEEAVKP